MDGFSGGGAQFDAKLILRRTPDLEIAGRLIAGDGKLCGDGLWRNKAKSCVNGGSPLVAAAGHNEKSFVRGDGIQILLEDRGTVVSSIIVSVTEIENQWHCQSLRGSHEKINSTQKLCRAWKAAGCGRGKFYKGEVCSRCSTGEAPARGTAIPSSEPRNSSSVPGGIVGGNFSEILSGRIEDLSIRNFRCKGFRSSR